MSTIQIVIITAIITAFVVFAAVLAWGEHQTRYLVRRGRDEKQHGAGYDVLKHAAAKEKAQEETGPAVYAA